MSDTNRDEKLCRFPSGTLERIDRQAKRTGHESSNSYIASTVIERLEKDEEKSAEEHDSK